MSSSELRSFHNNETTQHDTTRHGTISSTKQQSILSCIQINLFTTISYRHATTSTRQTDNLGENILNVFACLSDSVLVRCEHADDISWASEMDAERTSGNTEKFIALLSTMV
jgi:hypothetical protein